MSFIKSQFKNFLRDNGYHIILKNHVEGRNCPLDKRRKQDGHPSDCSHCFGTNLYYNDIKVLTRRSEANSRYGERLDYTDEIPVSGNTFNYYFLPEIKPKEKDWIIEYKNNELMVMHVINTDPNIGDGGTLSFRTVIAAETNFSNEVIESALEEIVY